MSFEHADYYRARATEEHALAAAAPTASIASIHLELAKKYESLVQDNPRQLRAAWNGMGRAQLG